MGENSNKNFTEKLSKARYAAYCAITEVIKNNAFARDVLSKSLDTHTLSMEDRAFAAKLTLGVMQTLCTLDDVIFRCVESRKDIKEDVLSALRISTYELIYLEKEPHAAVDQGVELVKYINHRARGLANLVLRRIVKLKSDFPFGNPEKSLEAFGRVYAVPLWQCELIIDSLGEKAGKSLIASSNGQPPLYIHVNQIKTTVNSVFEMFEELGGKPEIMKGLCGVSLEGCIRLRQPYAITQLRARKAMRSGMYFIADIASQAVANFAMLAADKPKNMLEFCAGKGNKTLMFQNISQRKWDKQLDLFTLDNVMYKEDISRERAKNFGVNVTSSILADATNNSELAAQMDKEFNGFPPEFDVVFVDAPCSGLGTFRRHPELKWRLSPEIITDMADKALSILSNAAGYVANGGILTYATCTVTKEENEEVCKRFLESEAGKGFRIKKFIYKDMKLPYLKTQTFSGMSDTHFACTFVKA